MTTAREGARGKPRKQSTCDSRSSKYLKNQPMAAFDAPASLTDKNNKNVHQKLKLKQINLPLQIELQSCLTPSTG